MHRTDAGHIAPRTGQTRDEAGFHGIGDPRDHNGDRGGGPLRRQRGWSIHRQDEVNLEPYEFLCQRGKLRMAPLGIPPLEG